jgi:hypothetical protein
MHLVGFIIKIYHDTWSHERQICVSRVTHSSNHIYCYATNKIVNIFNLGYVILFLKCCLSLQKLN